MADTLFDVRDLRKHFGGHAALRGITTELRRGEALFLIGPSGSGKSTFLRCLNLLERPDGGSLHFCGEDLLSRRCDVNRFRMRVGMVFQHFNLFPHLTVLENITLAPVLTKRLTAPAAERKALDLLGRIGLADKRNAYPPSSPAAKSNASPSSAPWRWPQRSCSSTSPPPPSTPRWSAKCSP